VHFLSVFFCRIVVFKRMLSEIVLKLFARLRVMNILSLIYNYIGVI